MRLSARFNERRDWAWDATARTWGAQPKREKAKKSQKRKKVSISVSTHWKEGAGLGTPLPGPGGQTGKGDEIVNYNL